MLSSLKDKERETFKEGFFVDQGTFWEKQIRDHAEREAKEEIRFRKELKDLDDEYSGMIAGLILFFVLAIIAIGVIIGVSQDKYMKRMLADGCVLVDRVYDKNDYCGKACSQEMYFHKYTCSVSPIKRIERTAPIRWTIATDRDDYVSRHRRN